LDQQSKKGASTRCSGSPISEFMDSMGYSSSKYPIRFSFEITDASWRVKQSCAGKQFGAMKKRVFFSRRGVFFLTRSEMGDPILRYFVKDGNQVESPGTKPTITMQRMIIMKNGTQPLRISETFESGKTP